MKNIEELILQYIGELLQESIFEGKVFLAGGAVRDKLLGLDVKDIDLVVNLPDGGLRSLNGSPRKPEVTKKESILLFLQILERLNLT